MHAFSFLFVVALVVWLTIVRDYFDVAAVLVCYKVVGGLFVHYRSVAYVHVLWFVLYVAGRYPV